MTSVFARARVVSQNGTVQTKLKKKHRHLFGVGGHSPIDYVREMSGLEPREEVRWSGVNKHEFTRMPKGFVVHDFSEV